ncbi:MAG: hypothetical protein CMN28_03920 [Salinisphaeraceae bacterium]|jgi:hypothetical protein|nr:hypothetical protein [Salinisphaeraceae bacterium]
MVEQTVLGVFFFLLVGHALGDFALQTDWMVRHKNHREPPPENSCRHPRHIWIHLLTAHALVHGGAVALTTGMVGLGIAETLAHWLIDYGKSDGRYGFHVDQLLHLGCKAVWLMIWIVAG